MAEETDNERRRMLTTVTTGVGLVGAGALAVPFVASMTPSARAKAAGAPVEVDISRLSEGQMLAVEWRGKPVWIIRRTPEMLEDLAQIREKLSDPDSEVETQQPAYAKNKYRSIKPEVLVVLGVCTHLGCAPTKKFEQGKASGVSDDWVGGFFCPCHGSSFDLAGRVYRNVPAPTNLEVPPYSFLSDDRVLIGVGPEDTA
ncbi:MAG TPA: ubiquinol-cytochrome c reductase iron-sulfur subunit [Planctomycetaceae bacterium]|jgi:ubiquinol-cytochrome c reductase iron-sulfur subunit|nr:ubiquinol-cytochrome c reductase iron-sulfur subunit [Planctomycetaceae bacterium]|tara:strand:+ start:484 stop:1083 length:600 start_codon:yes stop_codon:yes gene_type:complete